MSFPLWQELLPFFDELSEQGKMKVLLLVRQVLIDAASTLLGTLDGVVSLGPDCKLLLMDDEKTLLSGDLQSHFLNFVEKLRNEEAGA